MFIFKFWSDVHLVSNVIIKQRIKEKNASNPWSAIWMNKGKIESHMFFHLIFIYWVPTVHSLKSDLGAMVQSDPILGWQSRTNKTIGTKKVPIPRQKLVGLAFRCLSAHFWETCRKGAAPKGMPVWQICPLRSGFEASPFLAIGIEAWKCWSIRLRGNETSL